MEEEKIIDYIGNTVDGYEIEYLSSGGFAEVYKGVRKKDGKIIKRSAIKFLKKEHQNNNEIIKAFLREAEELQRIDNAHIVKIYKIGEIKGFPYFIMEYIDGISLSQYLKKLKAQTKDFIEKNNNKLERNRNVFLNSVASYNYLGVPLICNIIRQILHAMISYSAYEIVHRDIKPSNIQFTTTKDGYFTFEDSKIKIIDFGNLQSLSGNEVNVGVSKSYSSPELLDGEETDIRTDIYSLGILFYEFLTGKKLFSDRDDREAKNYTFKNIEILDPFCTDELKFDLKKFIKKAIAKDKENRFKTPLEMEKELHKIILNHSIDFKLDRTIYDVSIPDSTDIPIDSLDDIYEENPNDKTIKPIKTKVTPKTEPIKLIEPQKTPVVEISTSNKVKNNKENNKKAIFFIFSSIIVITFSYFLLKSPDPIQLKEASIPSSTPKPTSTATASSAFSATPKQTPTATASSATPSPTHSKVNNSSVKNVIQSKTNNSKPYIYIPPKRVVNTNATKNDDIPDLAPADK